MLTIANPFQNTNVLLPLLIAVLMGTGAKAHAEGLSVQAMTGKIVEQNKDEFLDFLCNNKASTLVSSKNFGRIVMLDACISSEISDEAGDLLVIDGPKVEVVSSKGWKFVERDNCYKFKGYYSITITRSQGGVASYVLAPANITKKVIATMSPNIKQCRW